MDVVLLGNGGSPRLPRNNNVEFIPVEDFYDPSEFDAASSKITLDASFRGGFWLKTFERLFVLEQYMVSSGLGAVFHAELDQLLFGTNELVDKLEGSGDSGIFFPFHGKDKAVASVFFCNSALAFRDLIESSQKGTGFPNEMAFLARWARHSTHFFKLPTLSDLIGPKNPSKTLQFFRGLDGVTDAAELGLWVGGRDPRNLPVNVRPSTKFRYPDDRAVLPERFLAKLRFRLAVDERGLWVQSSELPNETRLYNLHLHSKVHSWLSSGKGKLRLLIDASNFPAPAQLPSTRKSQVVTRARDLLRRILSNPSKAGTVLVAQVNSAMGWRPSSRPFISGDSFRKIANHIWESGAETLLAKELEAESVIFCRTNDLATLNQKVLRKVRVPVVLLLGNSDLSPPQEVSELARNPIIQKPRAKSGSTFSRR